MNNGPHLLVFGIITVFLLASVFEATTQTCPETTVYLNNNYACGSWTVSVPGFGNTPTASDVSFAIINAYYNGILTNTTEVWPGNTVTFSQPSSQLSVTVSQTYVVPSCEVTGFPSIGASVSGLSNVGCTVTSASPASCTVTGLSGVTAAPTGLNNLVCTVSGGSSAFSCTITGVSSIATNITGTDNVGCTVNTATSPATCTVTGLSGVTATPTGESSVGCTINYDGSTVSASQSWASVALSVSTSSSSASPVLTVNASDSSDQYVRDWELFSSYPGHYVSSGSYANATPFYSTIEGSSGSVKVTLPSASGTYYFAITQSGGSSYGTYSGSVSTSTGGFAFSGLDVNHILEISVSDGAITGVQVISVAATTTVTPSFSVTASDSSDQSARTWSIFNVYPGSYVSGSTYSSASPAYQYTESSGGTITIPVSGSGSAIYYFAITPSSGSPYYGSYSGTVTGSNGDTYSFTGLDEYYVIEVTVSNGAVTSVIPISAFTQSRSVNAFTITASDPSDSYARYWEAFSAYPGPYKSDGAYSDATPFYQTIESSGGNFSVLMPYTTGTFYFAITQSGGSSYGTYSGTLSAQNGDFPFSGLDAKDVLELSFSNGFLTDMGVVSVGSGAGVTTSSTTLTTTVVPQSTICVAAPGYLCSNPVINSIGNLSVTIGQSTGASIYNVALACASTTLPNGLPDPAGSLVYLSSSGSATGTVSNSAGSGALALSSGQTISVSGLKCFDDNGLPLSTNYAFTGYLWMNYTVQSGSPTGAGGSNPLYTVRIAALSLPGSSSTTVTTTGTTSIAPGASQLLVTDYDANSASTLIAVGNNQDNSVSQQIFSDNPALASSFGPSSVVVQAFGTNRILVAGYTQNETLQAAQEFVLALQSAGARCGPLSFDNVPILNAYGAPVAQVVIGSHATSADIEAADMIASVIANYSYGCTATSTVTTTPTTFFTTQTTTIPSNFQTFVLNLQPGWNLFSIPLQYAVELNGTCSSSNIVSPVWQLANGQYQKANFLYGGEGYWVDVSSACSAVLSGPALSLSQFPSLAPGWNMVGAPASATSFNSIAGTCSVTDGPYAYYTGSGAYQYSTELNPGSGYFVEVSSDCSLGSGTPPPPPSST